MEQETIEEVAERFKTFCSWGCEKSFIEGAKWQQERSYSEEDMMKAFYQGHKSGLGSENAITFKEWFKQFKK